MSTEEVDESQIANDTVVEDSESAEAAVEKLLAAQALRCPFGPAFFVSQLRNFVRDRCPDPSERLPLVKVRTVDGVTLNVCHIIGLAPLWVALAVYDEHDPGRPMRTEIVPYNTIVRVSICEIRPGGQQIGFSQSRQPTSF